MNAEDMTEDNIKLLAKTVVQETLLSMGIDVSTPAALVEMQADQQHLRRWRKSMESVQRQSITTSIAIAVTGLIAAALVALRGHS